MSLEKISARLDKVIASDKTRIGHYRFANKLKMLLPHVQAAAEGFTPGDLEGPAERLYRSRSEGNKARNALFHLEALCRMYRDTHSDDEDVFEALLTRFKELEDGFGRIDYHDEFKGQAANLDAGSSAVGYFTGGYHVELQNLTKRMKDSRWVELDDEGAVCCPAMKSILDQLEDVDWKKYRKDREGIIEALSEAAEKALKKGGGIPGEEGLDFAELEDGVHEFRRTVRWICIYLASLGGLCRIVGKDSLAADLSEYQTDDIVNNPYNALPVDPREKENIDIEASYYFSFSSLMLRIGDIKDDGQLAEAFEHALSRTGAYSDDDLHAAMHTLTSGKIGLDEIPGMVSSMVHRFVHEHRVPQRLMESLQAQLD